MAILGADSTEMILTALIVHEEEEYYLVEATNKMALERLKSDGEYLLSWLFDVSEAAHSEASVTAVMDVNELDALFARELKPDTNPRNRASTRTTSHGNPWRTRPNTNTWHPETTVRQTDEFSSEDTDALRDRLRADRQRVLDDSK